MGTATRTYLNTAVVALVASVAPAARADSCTGVTETGGRFATCFDLGNRLSVTGGVDGIGPETETGGATESSGLHPTVGLEIDLRHEITFEDDPDLEWKMEHVMLQGALAGIDGSFSGTLYRGRYLRHSRDGHIMLPLGTPKKVFLPFDIGAFAEVGTIDWRPADPTETIGVIRTAPLIDFARSHNYRRIFAFGPAAHWDIDVDRQMNAIVDHVVAPFTEGMMNLRLESSTGLYVAEARVEAGTAWRSNLGWKPEARAEASVERIILAFNDRPVALFAGVNYDSVRDEMIARIGARFVLFDRADPRVSLVRLADR